MTKERLQITEHRLQIGIFFLFSVLCVLCSTCYSQSISSVDLINNAKQYDGKVVSYQGEVIGDVMVRGNFAWVNLNDGNNAIGIWLEKNYTKDILYTGSYKEKGDLIEITGIFHRACLEHGGDLDIHAQGIKILQRGKPLIHRLNPGKRNFAILLGVILCLILIFRRWKKK
ncbi:MAG: DNA-binding protein [Candidatus Omnitrophota bacterium]